MDSEFDAIRKNIDYMILVWVSDNIFSNNLNQDLEYYIFHLRQTTTNQIEIDYLDYKLNIWRNIERKRNEE
jgi:hypothetical protein